jgi:hypothetical protein
MKSAKQIIQEFDTMRASEEPIHDYEEKESNLLEASVELLREMVTTPPEQQEQTEEEIMTPVNFKEGCFGMRSDIELIKAKCKNWLGHPEIIGKPEDFGELANYKKLEGMAEAQQNIMLAYRHLEDARMRLGKAVQAYDGGKSIYPR